MKFLALLRADSVHILIRFPAAIAVLGICLFAFLVTLPQGLFENGIAKISVAVVYGGQEEAADIFVNILRDLDPVKRLVRTDAQEAQVLLDEGDVDLVLELPSGIIDALANGGSSVIRVNTKNVHVANIAYAVTNQAVNAVNLLQGRALEYREAAQSHFSTEEEFKDKEFHFNTRLLGAALFRSDAVKVERSTPYYSIQLVAVLLYLTVGVLSVFMALTVARQVASGVLRRAALHKIPVWHFYAVKILTALVLSVPLSLICLWAALYFNLELSVPRMFLSSMALCAIVCPVCVAFASFAGKANTAYARTLLGCLAILLVLFFIGGGFYPAFSMDSSFRLFNPAWASHLLAEWVFRESADKIITVIPYLLLPAVCGTATIIHWRRYLR